MEVSHMANSSLPAPAKALDRLPRQWRDRRVDKEPLRITRDGKTYIYVGDAMRLYEVALTLWKSRDECPYLFRRAVPEFQWLEVPDDFRRRNGMRHVLDFVLESDVIAAVSERQRREKSARSANRRRYRSLTSSKNRAPMTIAQIAAFVGEPKQPSTDKRVRAQPTAADHSAANGDAPEPLKVEAPKRTAGRRGPKKNETTAAVRKFCYELIADDGSRTNQHVRNRCAEEFGQENAPSKAKTVPIYARRHAKDNDLPWPIPRGQQVSGGQQVSEPGIVPACPTPPPIRALPVRSPARTSCSIRSRCRMTSGPMTARSSRR
jgi:hypothetical protein